MSRIFVAINISEEARRLATAYADELRSGEPCSATSWVRPEKLHLTLRFIGNCTVSELGLLTEVVKRVAANTAPFDLAIEGTGVFPTTRRARVVWLGVRDPALALGSINACLRATDVTDAAAGIKREPFSPHLTIARIKDVQKCRAMIARHLESRFESPEFRVSEIVIYQSSLLPAGSVYKLLSNHRLTGELTSPKPIL